MCSAGIRDWATGAFCISQVHIKSGVRARRKVIRCCLVNQVDRSADRSFLRRWRRFAFQSASTTASRSILDLIPYTDVQRRSPLEIASGRSEASMVPLFCPRHNDAQRRRSEREYQWQGTLMYSQLRKRIYSQEYSSDVHVDGECVRRSNMGYACVS